MSSAKLYDMYLPQIRAAITAEAKISLREQIRDRKKKLMAMAKTATGKDSFGAEKSSSLRLLLTRSRNLR